MSLPTLSSLRLRLHCPPLDFGVILQNSIDSVFTVRRIFTKIIIVSSSTNMLDLPPNALACFRGGRDFYILVPQFESSYVNDCASEDSVKLLLIRNGSIATSVLLFRDDCGSEIEERAVDVFHISRPVKVKLFYLTESGDSKGVEPTTSMKLLSSSSSLFLRISSIDLTRLSLQAVNLDEAKVLVQQIEEGIKELHSQIESDIPSGMTSSSALSFLIDWTPPVLKLAKALTQMSEATFGKNNTSAIRLSFTNVGGVQALLGVIRYFSSAPGTPPQRDRAAREALEDAVQTLTNLAFTKVIQFDIVSTEGALGLLIARAQEEIHSKEVFLKIARCISSLSFENRTAKKLAVSLGVIAVGVEALRLYSLSRFLVEKVAQMLCSVLDAEDSVSELVLNDAVSVMDKIENSTFSSSATISLCFSTIRAAISSEQKRDEEANISSEEGKVADDNVVHPYPQQFDLALYNHIIGMYQQPLFLPMQADFTGSNPYVASYSSFVDGHSDSAQTAFPPYPSSTTQNAYPPSPSSTNQTASPPSPSSMTQTASPPSPSSMTQTHSSPAYCTPPSFLPSHILPTTSPYKAASHISTQHSITKFSSATSSTNRKKKSPRVD